METDILIYAIIAIVIFARLWSLLGQKNGDEPERPNPFATRASQSGSDDEDEAFSRPKTGPANAAKNPAALPAPRAAPDSLAGGLEKIRELDSAFDEKNFLQGARAAFLMIVEDFLKGDLSRSERLLAPSVREKFQAAIDARKARNEIVENQTLKLKEAECVAAKADNNAARIMVRFVSEQDNRIRHASALPPEESDSERQSMESPKEESQKKDNQNQRPESQREEITDLWTFTRDTTSQDPNWALSETRS